MKKFRKAAAWAASAALALSAVVSPLASVQMAAAAAEYPYGDVNNNGEVEIRDVILLNKNLLAGYPLTESQVAVADATGDGLVDVTDSLEILRYVIRLVDHLGPDETEPTTPSEEAPSETTTEPTETTAEPDPTEPTIETAATEMTETTESETAPTSEETTVETTTEESIAATEESTEVTATETAPTSEEMTTESDVTETETTETEVTEDSSDPTEPSSEESTETTESTAETETTETTETTSAETVVTETTEETEAPTEQETDADGNYNIDVTGAESVTVQFTGTAYAGLNGGYGYWDNNAENAEGGTGAWIEGSWTVDNGALDENGQGTWIFEVPEGVTSLQLYVNYYAVWSNEANDMVNLDESELKVGSILNGVVEEPTTEAEVLTGTTEAREMTTDENGNQNLDVSDVEKFQITVTGGQPGAAVSGYCGYWDNEASKWISIDWAVAGEVFNANGNAVAIVTVPEGATSLQVAVGYYASWDNDAGAMVDLDKSELTMSIVVQLAESNAAEEEA